MRTRVSARSHAGLPGSGIRGKRRLVKHGPGYAQALSGQRGRPEDAALLAATAEIEILAGPEVAGPARLLTDKVLAVHARIAESAGVTELRVGEVDRHRHALIDLFKADLDIPVKTRQSATSPAGPAPA